MHSIVNILSTIAIFAGALLILVFSHELGHFLAAKFFGMRVEKFSLGFPPQVWSIKKGETEYCIGATPLGGYVKISGMIDESMDTDYLDKEPQPWEFRSKPVWQRMIVISAGVIFNMILAALIFAGIVFSTGQQRIVNKSVGGLYVPDSSLAHQVGFRTGDKLIAVNGNRVKYFGDLFSPDQLTKSRLRYTLIRNAHTQTLTMPDSLLDELNHQPLIGFANIVPAKLGRILKGSPADSAGLKKGDEIIAINGHPTHYWMQFVGQVHGDKGPVEVTIKHKNSTFKKKITPNEKGNLGVFLNQNVEASFKVRHIKYSFFGSMGYGAHQSVNTLTGIIQGFHKMFSGDISVRKNLGGPVAIASLTRQATEREGWIGFWHITALLSVTLAIMNILPIPILDGGHLVFLLYEGITRREPSEKVRMALQQVGIVIIIGVMIFVTFNDILRLF